ncbi:MAG: hypothetical protein RL375_2620 [Pseudomonadota bacterium]|jgi:hypothetical protein
MSYDYTDTGRAGDDTDTDKIPSGFAELIDTPEAALPQPTHPARPVQLQINRVGGVWFKVCNFDAGNVPAEHFVRQAVELLCAVDPAQRWRVVVPGLASADVLLTYSADTGWHPA